MVSPIAPFALHIWGNWDATTPILTGKETAIELEKLLRERNETPTTRLIQHCTHQMGLLEKLDFVNDFIVQL